MIFDYSKYFNDFIDKQKEKNALRVLKDVGPAQGMKLIRSGKEYINLSSNSYLSLHNDEELIEAGKSAMEEYGCGSVSSRMLSGNIELYSKLEGRLARFKGFERALVFSSGYTANLGVISALMEKGDLIIIDRLVHASIIDGMRLSGVTFKTFPHNDYAALRSILEERRSDYKKVLIAVESVYSMDGDTADLNELCRIKEEHNALLLVDEAHATGVFGERGSGMIEEQRAQGVDIEIGTLSKAVPSVGGYVCSGSKVIEYITNKSRALTYSTALPPSALAVSIAALDKIESMKEERRQYRRRAEEFRRSLTGRGFETYGSRSQIIPLRTGSNERTLAAATELEKAGIIVGAVRPPTVPKGEGRLRLSLCLGHDSQQIEKMLNALSNL